MRSRRSGSFAFGAFAATATLAGSPAVALDHHWIVPVNDAGRPVISLSRQPSDEWEVWGGRRDDQIDLSPQAPAARKLIDGDALLLKIAPPARDGGKGRWFVYAAGSGKAFGLNLMRDPQDGWRRSGWSVERLAEVGKIQAGVGWRKGDARFHWRLRAERSVFGGRPGTTVWLASACR